MKLPLAAMLLGMNVLGNATYDTSDSVNFLTSVITEHCEFTFAPSLDIFLQELKTCFRKNVCGLETTNSLLNYVLNSPLGICAKRNPKKLRTCSDKTCQKMQCRENLLTGRTEKKMKQQCGKLNKRWTVNEKIDTLFEDCTDDLDACFESTCSKRAMKQYSKKEKKLVRKKCRIFKHDVSKANAGKTPRGIKLRSTSLDTEEKPKKMEQGEYFIVPKDYPYSRLTTPNINLGSHKEYLDYFSYHETNWWKWIPIPFFPLFINPLLIASLFESDPIPIKEFHVKTVDTKYSLTELWSLKTSRTDKSMWTIENASDESLRLSTFYYDYKEHNYVVTPTGNFVNSMNWKLETSTPGNFFIRNGDMNGYLLKHGSKSSDISYNSRGDSVRFGKGSEWELIPRYKAKHTRKLVFDVDNTETSQNITSQLSWTYGITKTRSEEFTNTQSLELSVEFAFNDIGASITSNFEFSQVQSLSLETTQTKTETFDFVIPAGGRMRIYQDVLVFNSIKNSDDFVWAATKRVFCENDDECK